VDYASFVSGIDFRFIKPDRPRPKGYRGVALCLRRAGIHLEVLNTRLPSDEKQIRRTLAPLCSVPRMSTFAIGAIIQRGVAQMPDGQVFVNVGVWNGFTFLSGMAGNADKKCIGVDLYGTPTSAGPRASFLARFETFRRPKHVFHQVDYKEYFERVHTEPIGFYVFDGPHSYHDQLDGLKIAEPFLAAGATILVDDTNTDRAYDGTMDFVKQSSHEYRVLLDQRTPKGGHPTYWNGVLVIQKAAASE